MTRLVRFSNNAVSNLAANLTNVATSLSVTSGDGAKFPALSAGQYFMATLVKADGSTEVVKVTARSTDTLTIVRAAEPVAGASTAYAFSAGDRIEARLTAGVLSDEIDRLDNGAVVEAVNKSANYTLVEADVTKLVRVTTTSGTTTITLPATSALTDDYDVIVAKVTSDANTVVIARTGSTDLINGATSYTIYNQWQSAWLIADRSTNTWTVISSGISAVNTVVDAGTGSGSASITLSGDPGSINNTALFIGSVYQQKSTYSISGTTLTAGGAIASGVGYEVVWSAPLTVGTPSDGTVTTAKLAANAVTPAKMSTGAPSWDTSGNVTLGGSLVAGSNAANKLSVNGNSTGQPAYLTATGTDTNVGIDVNTKGTGAARVNVNGQTVIQADASLVTLPFGQLKFPAAQNASSDANTLDDYEEGTWTPVLVPTAGTITSQVGWGSYTKIGNQVTVTFRMAITGGTVTAIGTVSGLPFASQNANQQACGAARETNVDGTMWELVTSGNTAIFTLWRYNNTTNVTNAFAWTGSFTYLAA